MRSRRPTRSYLRVPCTNSGITPEWLVLVVVHAELLQLGDQHIQRKLVPMVNITKKLYSPSFRQRHRARPRYLVTSDAGIPRAEKRPLTSSQCHDGRLIGSSALKPDDVAEAIICQSASATIPRALAGAVGVKLGV